MIGNVLTNRATVAVAPLPVAPVAGYVASPELVKARALALELARAGHWIEFGDEIPRPKKLPTGKEVLQAQRDLMKLNGATAYEGEEEPAPRVSPLWRVVERHGGTLRQGGRVELLRGPLTRPDWGQVAQFGVGRVCPECGSLLVKTNLYVKPDPTDPTKDAGYLVLISCLRSLPKSPGTAVECDYMEVL